MSQPVSRLLERLQDGVVGLLVEHRMATSLVDVERALAAWRSGASGVLAAHGAVLRHVQSCQRTVERLSLAVGDRPEGVLRDALDAGLVSETEFFDLVGEPSGEVAPAGSLGDAGDADARTPNKQATLESLLQRSAAVDVYVDARRAGVDVPPRLRSDPRLVLRLGYRLTPPIPDLHVGDDGVRATLRFGGVPYGCVLPWTAVYAVLAHGERWVTIWPEDVPPDATLAASSSTTDAAASGSTEASPTAASAMADANARGRGHLRIVE